MSLKNIIKKWLGTQEDISHAEEKTRKEVTERLTAEKDSAVKRITAEKDNMLKIPLLQGFVGSAAVF